MHKVNFRLLLILLFLLPNSVWASVAGEVNKANDLYKQGQFDGSLELYQKALDHDDKSPVVKYDLGTAFYKKGDYDKALRYLEQAAEDKNVKIEPKAEYNIGNVLYRSGMQKAKTNVDEAIKSLQEALGHYGQTLTVDPKDQDALFNEDYVKKEIERLKEQKQQQQQQNQQQDQKQQRQNQKDQQSKQNQQGQQNQQKQQESQQSQQNNSKEQKGQQSSESRAQEQKKALDQAEESQKELDRKQAQDMLEDYQENEEPKKLLNYMPKKIDDRPVLKDW